MKNNGAVLLEVQLDAQTLRKGILSADNPGQIMEETSLLRQAPFLPGTANGNR